jgi:hypothetical protein
MASSTEFDTMRHSLTSMKQRLQALEGMVAQFVPQDSLGSDGRPMYAFVKTEEQPTLLHDDTSRRNSLEYPVESGSTPFVPVSNALERVREGGSSNVDSDGEGPFLLLEAGGRG